MVQSFFSRWFLYSVSYPQWLNDDGILWNIVVSFFVLADDHSVFFFPGGNGDSVGNIISKEEFPASHV